MIKAIIFDLDDTLYEERDYVMSGFQAVADFLEQKGYDARQIFLALEEDYEKGIRHNNFEELITRLNVQEDVQELLRVYRVHKPRLALCDDAKILLEQLKGKVRLAILADGHPEVEENKIDALGIRDVFDVIMINDFAKGLSKKNVEPFKWILQQLGTTASDCLLIVDNPLKDFEAAKSLGIKTVRIHRNGGQYYDIKVEEEMDADITVKDLGDVLKIIEEGEDI